MHYKLVLFLFILISITACNTIEKKRFQAYYATIAPTIDGNPNDTVWNAIPSWYRNYHIWINNVDTRPDTADFSWRYKLAWDENKFYVLAEIKDDLLSDIYPDPTVKYWEDDCFEVLFDEDNSGGDHQTSYQAFIYHISILYDAMDIDDQGKVVQLNKHLQVQRQTTHGTHIWEAAFDIYDKNYSSREKNTPVQLYPGKVMGWAMAYCDNDGNAQRDHFFGTNAIQGNDKNQTWKNADTFGEVVLVQ